MDETIPSVPPGWSIGPQGEPISPEGQVYAPGTTFDVARNPVAPGGLTGFPVLSTLAGGVAGKMIGKSTNAMIAGAILGYWTKILEK